MSYFTGRDGVQLAYRETGEGRPLVMLHGIAGNAAHWQRYGFAERMAASGHRVIMPDLRGHGSSAQPHDPAAYPPDVLADDGLALIEHLRLQDYDLGGYSLGGRLVVRMLARGATPRRAVVGAQGMLEVLGEGGGMGGYLLRIFAGWGTFPPGSPEERTEHWLRQAKADPVAIEHVMGSLVATRADEVSRIEVPVLVVMGTDDERARSAGDLVAALPHGTLAMVPGDHGTAPAAPEFTAVIADFLAR